MTRPSDWEQARAKELVRQIHPAMRREFIPRVVFCQSAQVLHEVYHVGRCHGVREALDDVEQTRIKVLIAGYGAVMCLIGFIGGFGVFGGFQL